MLTLPGRGVPPQRRVPSCPAAGRSLSEARWVIDVSDTVREVITVGSGPAGHTAALSAARAPLRPMAFEGVRHRRRRVDEHHRRGELPRGSPTRCGAGPDGRDEAPSGAVRYRVGPRRHDGGPFRGRGQGGRRGGQQRPGSAAPSASWPPRRERAGGGIAEGCHRWWSAPRLPPAGVGGPRGSAPSEIRVEDDRAVLVDVTKVRKTAGSTCTGLAGASGPTGGNGARFDMLRVDDTLVGGSTS